MAQKDNYAATVDGGNLSVDELKVRTSNVDRNWGARWAISSLVSGWALTPGSGMKTVQAESPDGNGATLGVVTNTLKVQCVRSLRSR